MDAAIRYLLGSVFGVDLSTRFGRALHFFVEDSVKVLFLLYTAITVIGVLRTYISKQTVEKYIGSKNKFLSSFMASLLAIFTPFCSCSGIPVFLSLIKMRVPFSAAICFLAVSPLVNEYLLVLMPAYFGFTITAIYLFGGIAIGMIGGWILEKLGMEKHLEESVSAKAPDFIDYPNFKARLHFGLQEGKEIVQKLWIWILVGVALGAAVHNYIPDALILKASNAAGIFSVPLVALLGAPIYGSCAGVVPIALIFFSKPIALGTSIAFLMSVSALSLPEAIILRGAMKLKLLAAFFLTVFLGIVALGYFINFVSPYILGH